MRPCLKRGARALFDFRLRFQISDFDFQSAIPGLFWGLAPFDLWYLSKQSGNTVAILYGVTLAAIAAIGSLSSCPCRGAANAQSQFFNSSSH